MLVLRAMHGAPSQKRPICRSVGDPIDVVTGANFFELLDFRLVGPLPLLWKRCYTTQYIDQRLALGWGHTHGFDHTLTFDLEGICYRNSMQETVGFPPLESDGDSAAADGLVLEKISEVAFALHEPGEPDLEFELVSGESVAHLSALRQGESSIQLEYQAGRLSGMFDSLRRYIIVRYDEAGRLMSLDLSRQNDTDERQLLQYAYNDQGDLVDAIDPARSRTQYGYDSQHRMVTRSDRRGYSFLYQYDSQGRCTSSGGEDGMQEVRLNYCPGEGMTEVISPNGGKWQYFYDGKGAITQIIDPLGGIYSFAYDEAGRLIQEMDPNKTAHSISYDDTGAPLERPIYSARLVGPPPFYEPPAENADHWVADNPLEFEYGNLLTPETLNEPPALELLGPDVPVQVRALIRTSSLAPATESINAPGCFQPEPTSRSAQDCHRGVCDCDDFGLAFNRSRVGQIYLDKFADGTSRRWKYDPNANIQTYTDREGRQYGYEYASWDKLVRFTDPLGRSVDYQYSPTEELTEVRDPGGTASEYKYDLKDRLTHVYFHGTLNEEYRYDAADNLVGKYDAAGNQLLGIAVGPDNREASVTLASGERHEFAYDEAGHIARAATKECEVLCEYDNSGRCISDLQNGLGIVREPSDVGGENVTVLGKFTIAYEFVDEYTLKIIDPGGRSHTVQSLPGGLLHRRMGNGTEELAQFDRTGRCLLKASWRDEGNGRTWVRQYDYSPEGDLTGIRDSQRGEESYHYNAAHQLIGSARSNARIQEFRYDPADNLLSHPELNGASFADGNRITAADSETFRYNDRDHISAREGPEGRTDYEYDSLDILHRVRSSTGETSFTYDPLGRRITKTHNGRTTRFHWEGDRLAAEIDPEGRVRIYVYADALSLVPLLFLEYESLDSDPQSPKRYYLFTNQVGVPILVEDELGQAVWSAKISPYGTAKVQGNSGFVLPLRFPGHYFDEQTGLHYNRFRYYDPRLGRYLQADPTGIGGGLNLYAYPSQPLTQVDVQGLKRCECCPPGGPKSGKPCKPPRKKATAKKTGAKRGPKTDPKAPHNAKIRSEANKLARAGNKIIAGGGRKPEKAIPTPGGNKDSRRPDILYETKSGEIRGRNVGKTKADGSPVTREQKAMDDLNGAGVKTDFVPYDR